MKTIAIRNISAGELFRQQVSATMQRIRYRQSGDTREYIPMQMGGLFVQRELLSGGNALRITEVNRA